MAQKKRPEKGWPSVDEQLEQAGVIHGSQLEALVRSCQDTTLLRPEEHEGDDIGVPVWLRVHYRANHPDQPPAPAGPAGDYPEYLENLLEYLTRNQNSIED